MKDDHAAELKRDLVDLRHVLDALGLLDRSSQRQAGGYIIRCPWHQERTPSCSVQNRGGVLVAHCFACDGGGDVLSLVAQVHGFDIKTDFQRVLVAAAELANRWDIIESIEGREQAAQRKREAPPRPPPRPAPERDYPALAEVEALWDSCSMVTDDPEVAAWLESRAISPHTCAVRDLCRALPIDAKPPSWARFRGVRWPGSGHRCIVPMFDAEGRMRSFRARAVRAAEHKTLVPTGCKAGGLVMADPLARMVLETGTLPSWWPDGVPLRVVVAEGDPDFLTWGCRADRHSPPLAVLGVESGGWSEALADRIPDGAHIVIRTDDDQAGNKYANEVQRSLASRCRVYRTKRTP